MNEPVRILGTRERVKLRVADFEMLAEGGAFAEHGTTELIDGDIYFMNAQFARHARAKMHLATALIGQLAALGVELQVLTEVSVQVADDSMPQPDVVLTNYAGDRALPVESVGLVVEISATTLDFDLGRKSDLYAAAGVPEYWVVDLEGKRVLMHEHPSADGYLGQLDVLFGESLISATIEGLVIDSGVLGA
jgi:Uma2 family endonuclease